MWSWAELPAARVVRLDAPDPDALTLSIDPLPEDAPAIATYFAAPAPSAAALVAEVLSQLETAAAGLYPAWLPGAEGITAGGAGVSAVRALAFRLASGSGHFGPFLAQLAETSLAGAARRPTRFAPEVRAAGLARVLAAGFRRSRAALLVHVPPGLTVAEEEALVSGCEWLAYRGELGMWLTGAPLLAVDRVEAMTVRRPATETAPVPLDVPQTAARALRFPAVAGMPHPASSAEKALEAALASREWARGRAWNQTHQSGPLTNPIRVDLLWRDERCVVEIDGPEHRVRGNFEADRRRDVQLQLDGFAVLRFTNAHVMTDTDAVVVQIERFLQDRRAGTFEGSRYA
ncbi:DUF559 domain-containing protein [Planotetraspora sp. A-T 1434]|uniref:endonuclease domain-containing protein n=1 Tax=Planotetraspora sp. A-T 1434 TaxID=2979219 RepID=UPI0021BF06CC|nr:DUF559 domain-containing protein [Planotetraspora sp. A-T 1434]MCT9934274.1 DUF559 domain-containing protein [Planotetraspora sp. A-T 1434]